MEKNESNTLKFKDRVSEHPNRRKLNIISQTAETIIADIDYADQVTEENKGSSLNADTLNAFDETISKSNEMPKKALEKSRLCKKSSRTN